MATELRVLGQVEVRVDGRLVEVGHARQRCVLAVLLVDANRVVTVEQLLDRVWTDRLPHKPRQVASNYVSRLRRVLAGEVAIVRQGGGYVLKVDPDAVDLHRFRRLVEQARGRDDAGALALLEEAAGLWWGEAFEGVDTPWFAAVREGLARERFAADVDRVDLALAHGRHAVLSAELTERADAHPLDERVTGQLMLALYRNGRQAEALLRFDGIRARLADEVGADPGTPLRDLHRRILDTDPALARAAAPDVPWQLPAPPVLTGRVAELTLLDRMLAGTSGTVLISAIGGTGGIGKTWLALAWAHRHLDRFPDGQLFVDLHGFSPAGEPAAPEAAVRGFLDALGVDPGRIPGDLDAQAALYRSLVAERRMLVVLDNAATADQVIPLLPGSPTCTVLVTGRRRLASLIDRHGARHLQLDVLTDTEAHQLLAGRLDRVRTAAEPDALDELVALCGRYPLALAITARHAATRPDVPLAEFAAELRELGLDALDDDTDTAASLPAVLSWSLRGLTTEQRTAFALLGVAPGPDIGLAAATSLTGLSAVRTRKVLRALEDASLLDRHAGHRHAMHDLVRAYAATLAHDLDESVRQAALGRVVDFYLHTAHNGDRRLDPHRRAQRMDPPAPGSLPTPLHDIHAALAWFKAEHTCLLAALRTAIAQRWYRNAWHLAWNSSNFLLRRGHRRDHLTAWHAGLVAAEHLGDPGLHAVAHRRLANCYADLWRHDDAISHLEQALVLTEQHHDHVNEAATQLMLARTWQVRSWQLQPAEQGGAFRQALEHATRASTLFHTANDPTGEAGALNALAYCAARLGDHDQARDRCQAALALYRRHPDPGGEADAWDTMGYIAHRTSRHHEAIDCYQRALDLLTELGHTYHTAAVRDRLGDPYAALGRHDQARALWRTAEQVYRTQHHHAAADRVQRQLDALPQTSSP